MVNIGRNTKIQVHKIGYIHAYISNRLARFLLFSIGIYIQGRRETTLIGGGGGVHWIARICYFYKIARILLDALTTTNVATCDRIFHYFARISPYFVRIFPVFLNFGGCDTPHTVVTPLYISRIDSFRGSLPPSARSYTLQLFTLTNNTFVNLTNHDISRLYTSTSGYMLFRHLNNICGHGI